MEYHARWYFGGIAATCAVFISHPFDLIKANLQTSTWDLSTIRFTRKLIAEQGFLSLYNGISAAVLRQLTYALSRSALYELIKRNKSADFFHEKIVIASIAGTFGGFIGTPADLVNVRMQNDVKLPSDKKRNYKHALDGIIRVFREEGVKKLFSGATSAMIRGLAMTIGQVACYDHFKQMLRETGHFSDSSIITHLSAAVFAVLAATTLTQPIDVLKTRAMNAEVGKYKGFIDVFKSTVKTGPMTFFKGYGVAFLRVGPHTIITYLIVEQLRLRYGVVLDID